MTDLLLQPMLARGPNDYDGIADDWIVGRIVLSDASPAERPWMWSLGSRVLSRPRPDAWLRSHAGGRHAGFRQVLAPRD